MPKNAYCAQPPDEMPVELQLDLLVDGELPESQRRMLLGRMDLEPGQWRDLAIRFLQQQTEKQSVKALMAGGRLVPVAEAPTVRRAVIGRVGWFRLSAVAAGLMIAAGSALVTLMMVRPGGTVPGQMMASHDAAEFETTLPADVASAALTVRVPMVPVADNALIFPAALPADKRPAKTSYVVQSDGKGGYVVIPVSMSKSPVY